MIFRRRGIHLFQSFIYVTAADIAKGYLLFPDQIDEPVVHMMLPHIVKEEHVIRMGQNGIINRTGRFR